MQTFYFVSIINKKSYLCYIFWFNIVFNKYLFTFNFIVLYLFHSLFTCINNAVVKLQIFKMYSIFALYCYVMKYHRCYYIWTCTYIFYLLTSETYNNFPYKSKSNISFYHFLKIHYIYIYRSTNYNEYIKWFKL